AHQPRAFSAALREVPRGGWDREHGARLPDRDPELHRCLLASAAERRATAGRYPQGQGSRDAALAWQNQRGASAQPGELRPGVQTNQGNLRAERIGIVHAGQPLLNGTPGGRSRAAADRGWSRRPTPPAGQRRGPLQSELFPSVTRGLAARRRTAWATVSRAARAPGCRASGAARPPVWRTLSPSGWPA